MSSPPLVTMEQAVLRAAELPLSPLLRNEEYFMGLRPGGKQFPPVVSPPPGKEMARACVSSVASWPAWKFDSICFSFVQKYLLLAFVINLAQPC